MKSNGSIKDDSVLEQNVSTLLGGSTEPPRLADTARARIRSALIAKHAVESRTRVRSPFIAIGIGLAATVVAAVIITRVVNTGENAPPAVAGTDDATWIVEPGAKVTQLGPRRVRVEGAALLDVAPGKGPFVVETARGRIEVVGTRFLVDAEAERTTAAVVRGIVVLASNDGQVTLHAGEQAVAEPGRPPTRGPAPRLTSLVSWAKAARKRDEHAIKPMRNGTLFAREPNRPNVPESPLPIAKLGVDIVIEDQVARVALDQTFHNPQTMVMEGMYRFAIPPDASLQRLAMYVNGQLNEAAVVERMRARRIYEEIVYRRLDPALLEWAGTGRLSLRIYPLPPREDKRLLLAYTQSLPRLYDDWSIAVPLPEVDLPVGEVSFDVRVRGCANCEIVSTSHKIEVARRGEDAFVTHRQRNATIGDSLVLRVRDPRRQAVIASHADKAGDFLLVRSPTELPRAPKTYRPRTWVILDDVSASRGPSELAAQTHLVDSFLRELDEDDRVAVVAFDVGARVKLPVTRVIDVDRKAMRAALKEEGRVGATDVGAAFDTAIALLAGVPAADATIVYLGDGVITSGTRHLDALRARLAGKARFVGVGVGDGPDVQTLEALAAATGGYATTIDLADDVGWRAFDLVAALHTTRATGLTAKLVDATGALVPATLYLRSPQLADGEELELVARLAGGNAPVAAIVSGTIDGAPWEQRVALDGTRRDGGYLPRLWAQRHIAARLLAKHETVIVPPCVAAAPVAGRRGPQPAPVGCPAESELRDQRDERIRQEIVALGKQYFLLSRHTSLLVLENDAMYKQYGVTKGAGDTWAPYEVPAKIPVVPWTPSGGAPAGVADDATLVRSPQRVFYDHGHGFDDGWWNANETISFSGRTEGRGRWDIGGGYFGVRAQLGLRDSQPRSPPPPPANEPMADSSAQKIVVDKEVAKEERKGEAWGGEDAEADLDGRVGDIRTVTSGELLREAGTAGPFASTIGFGSGSGSGFGRGGGGGKRWHGGQLLLQRFVYPTDMAFDDLTNFVPALFPDAADALRVELEASGGRSGAHAIDGAARALLDRARRAVPTGVYRWSGYEIAVDSARRIGWRRTTETDLAETASYDGTTWTRRYAELGLDVTRPVADDDVALALAYLPLWIAEPAHYARWFEVRSRGPREVALSRPASKTDKTNKAELAYVLVFDDAHHLVAIRDPHGKDLVTIVWSGVGPIGATVFGEDVGVGFTGQAIGDAPAWAHGTSRASIAIEQPGHLVAYWDTKLAKLSTGSPEWRHVQRQRMVSLAALGNRRDLFAAFEALRAAGGVELGDVVLASGGIATSATDKAFAAVLASVADHPVVRYLIAGRAYGKAPAPERMKPAVTTGLVGAVWALREITALVQANQSGRAADRLVALGDRAFELRLVGATLINQHYQGKPADMARAWDTVAVGAYKNLARSWAAQALSNRGAYEAAAERVVALVTDLDLQAMPPHLNQVIYQVRNSRRGQAGWQLVWSTWRDRVLAGSSYEHVMALLAVANQHPADLPAILARASELAGGDTDRTLAVARHAINTGHAAWAFSLVEPLVKARPSRELHQMVAQMMIAQGRTADALTHLEAAQRAAGDEQVSLTTLRAELRQIIQLGRQLAVQSTGLARTAAVARAMSWGSKWRDIDPGNNEIDQQLGELLLAVGDKAEAWRHLSSVIERDPMSGDGYEIIANAFERQGRVAEAVDYWHQAMVIDQTNPTHRLRKAQALIALGRTAEGDAILADISSRKWHARWEGIAYQAKELLARAKQPQP